MSTEYHTRYKCRKKKGVVSSCNDLSVRSHELGTQCKPSTHTERAKCTRVQPGQWTTRAADPSSDHEAKRLVVNSESKNDKCCFCWAYRRKYAAVPTKSPPSATIILLSIDQLIEVDRRESTKVLRNVPVLIHHLLCQLK